jgi:drug/metabolite transporter (DMT)-like permease
VHTQQHSNTQLSRRRGLCETVRAWNPSTATATSAIVATSVAYGFAAFFARRLTDEGISAATVAFARFAITAVVLVRFLRLDRPRRTATVWGFSSGAAMALGWVAFVQAIDSGDVANAGIVYMTYPLFTLIAMRVTFRSAPTAMQIAGGLLVVVAAAVALGPGSGSGSGVPLLTFAAPATFGFGIAVLTERLGPLDAFERLASVAMGASVGLLPLIATLPTRALAPSSPTGWAWMVGIGVGCALIPMTIYAAAAPTLGAARTAVAGSAELPTVFLIGALFFGEGMHAQHVVAGVIIAVAIALTSTSRGPKPATPRSSGRSRPAPAQRAASSSSKIRTPLLSSAMMCPAPGTISSSTSPPDASNAASVSSIGPIHVASSPPTNIRTGIPERPPSASRSASDRGYPGNTTIDITRSG